MGIIFQFLRIKGNSIFSKFFNTICFLCFQNISPRLVPVAGLEEVQTGVWQSLDNDPKFILKSSFFNFLSGWVSIRVKLSSVKMLTPKLYFDFGEGFSEARSIVLYPISEDTYQADFVLPSSPKKVRFDPCEELTTFEISMLQFRAHCELFHIINQFASIVKHDYHSDTDTFRIYKKSVARYKKHGLQGMLERLDKEYTKLHPFRKQRATSKYAMYLRWIKQNEIDIEETAEDTPLLFTTTISIVMPVYNTPIEFLKLTIDSVINQTYPHWELCIADDASSDKEVTKTLLEYTKYDKRIHVRFREHNGGISVASNTALSFAKGEYVAFLDHDDILATNALYEVVKTLYEYPHTKFIYTDEDKIDEKGRRFDPHFKSAWNPDMFLSQNYLSHLSVVHKPLLDKVGYFRVGYEGAQDYDLYLRATRELSPQEIVHIAKILYHWRALEGSTAFTPEAKPYTSEAGLKALKDYFSQSQENISVEMGLLPNTYKVSYPLACEPKVSVIIPTRDGYDILSKCIESILKNTLYKNYEIIIIDNQTTCQQTLEYLETLKKRHLHIRVLQYNKKFNYSAINNFAVKHAKGELLALVNNDIEVITPSWLTEMVEHAVRPAVGPVGAKLYYSNDTIQHAGVILGIGGVAGHSHKYFKKEEHGYFSRLKIIQNYSAVTGACLVVRKELYEAVGGLDEKKLTIAFNDIDFCMKLHKEGFRNVWTPYAELYHHESVSRGTEDDEVKKARFEKEVLHMKDKWGASLKEDKCYNKNLTLKHEDLRLNSDE